MSITAVIEQGIIKIPGDVPWASGTVVRIEPVDEQTPTIFATLKDFDGMAGDLPPDHAAKTCGELADHWKKIDRLRPDEAKAFADDMESLRPI